MINQIRNIVQSILNKNNYGYLSPEDYNNFAIKAQLDVFLGFFEDYNTLINNQNLRRSGSEYANQLKIIEENIEAFIQIDNLTPVGDGVFFLPSLVTTGTTMLRLDKLLCYDVTSVGPPLVRTFKGEAEKVTHSKLTMLANSNLTVPDSIYPVYSITGNQLTVLPGTFDIAGEVEATYVRYPRDPKWTYQTFLGGEPVFDQSQPDYQDFEVGRDELPALVMNILKQAGLSIREEEVVRYVQVEKAQESQG